MGVGAIVILVLMTVLTLQRANRFQEEDDDGAVVVASVLFSLEVGILVLGNPWVWAVFVLMGAAKLIYWPSPETAQAAEQMPAWAHNVNILTSVAFSGALFWLFQWLR